MKNSDLKRFYEPDNSNNNEGFARLNKSGKLDAPVASNKIDTGNTADGKLMAADGHGGVKFVEQGGGGGGGSDPYVTSFGRFIDYYPIINGDNNMITYVKALNPYPNKTIGELKQEFNNNSIIAFGIGACAGNARYPVMIVDVEINEDDSIGFYIYIGDQENEVTEFTDENTINDIIDAELSFIASTSVNPYVSIDKPDDYPIISPITFCEYVSVESDTTPVINARNMLQVSDVAALLEERLE